MTLREVRKKKGKPLSKKKTTARQISTATAIAQKNFEYAINEISTGRSEIKFTIIVPSTDFDKKISVDKFNKRIKETERKLINLFGGSTQINTIGKWKENTKIISEKGARVESYIDADKLTRKRNKSTKILVHWLKQKQKDWNQYELAVEVEDDMFFIRTE